VNLRNKFVSQIPRSEILDLIAQSTVEDDYIEFKTELFHPRKPAKQLEDEKEDLLADLAGFANAAGGLVAVGIAEDDQGRASSLVPVAGDEAAKLANAIRDLAVAYIKPGMPQLEVVPFKMKDDGSEWIVLIRVPDGLDKPYMSAYRDRTRFAMRVGNRKRSMAYGEIQQGFLANPQEMRMAQLVSEIESIKSLISDLTTKLGR
jgi:predicted HTH transcriptional regulator